MKAFFTKAREWVWLEGDPDKDRSVGLAIAGALEMGLGVLSFSLAMLLLIVVSSTGLGSMKTAHFWLSMGFLFYMTGWFIVMGLGSVKARRWAPALILVGAWVTIFFGTLALALALYILPEALGLLMDTGISAGLAMGLLYFIVVALVVLQVLFPLLAIAFYSLGGVRATCERLDPKARWTDRVPLPLLAMGCICAFGSLSIVFGATTNYVVFLFGRVVNGAVGMVIVALISAGYAYVGWGAFTRKKHAWWGAYALVLLTSSSMMLTFSELEMATLYESMGYAPAQIEQFASSRAVTPTLLTFASCVWGIMACIYLVWTRDCFHPEKDRAVVKSYQRRKAEEEAAKPVERQGPRMRLED